MTTTPDTEPPAALAPGGTIRLSTPDVERTVHLYLAADATANEHLARHRRRGYAAEYPVDLLRVTFGENGHRFCYDLHALRTELERAGFVAVRSVEVHASVDPARRGLEARSSPTEALTTLVVEADRAADLAGPGARPDRPRLTDSRMFLALPPRRGAGKRVPPRDVAP